jgi:tricarballylate dehydrogenase
MSVIVVGAGNAALCAALAARESGADVTVLERAPENLRGGNSYFTGGLLRFAHRGADDIVGSFEELAGDDEFDLADYTESDFFDDLAHMTQYRSDPDLAQKMVWESRSAMEWLHEHGVRFSWSFGRHAFKVNGRFQFWGGAPLEVVGGGAGLVDKLAEQAVAAGVKILYNTRAVALLTDESGGVCGVRVRDGSGRLTELAGTGVVLASGGFEANTEMRARYLGPGWDLAKVRGTAFNTGDGLRMAMDVGAVPFGHWSGCHAVAWDANAPLTGDRSMGDEFSRHSYPMGLVVNTEAKRFLDEGLDFQTHTYAKYGAEILNQPGIVAYQLFDAQTQPYLRGDYRGKRVSKFSADTIEELAVKLELDPTALAATVGEFNAAVGPGEFNPNVKDGKSTVGLTPPKSNWAVALDTPPFLGFPVTTGITFTFGGLRVNAGSEVLDAAGAPIAGLFAAGEVVGGLFYHNYPSGSGLTSGTVFGRTAGASAAA